MSSYVYKLSVCIYLQKSSAFKSVVNVNFFSYLILYYTNNTKLSLFTKIINGILKKATGQIFRIISSKNTRHIFFDVKNKLAS